MNKPKPKPVVMPKEEEPKKETEEAIMDENMEDVASPEKSNQNADLD